MTLATPRQVADVVIDRCHFGMLVVQADRHTQFRKSAVLLRSWNAGWNDDGEWQRIQPQNNRCRRDPGHGATTRSQGAPSSEPKLANIGHELGTELV